MIGVAIPVVLAVAVGVDALADHRRIGKKLPAERIATVAGRVLAIETMIDRNGAILPRIAPMIDRKIDTRMVGPSSGSVT